MKKIKILFIMIDLIGGGAERVILTIIKHLDRQKFIPILVLFRAEGPFLKDVPSDVQILDCKIARPRYGLFAVYNVIRNTKPDIVFSCGNYTISFLIIIAKIFLKRKTKFVTREKNTVSEQMSCSHYSKLKRKLYEMLCPYFDKIICQCNYMKDDLVLHFRIPPQKMIVINNPIDIELINTLAVRKNHDFYIKNKINLLAVGRLEYQKGYDYMLQALGLLDNKYHLSILGVGSLEKELTDLVERLGISHRVHFIGFKDNPYSYMASADLFVLSSRFEGFPNVVLEANACGLPVVAFRIPSISEIIDDGVNGLSVEFGNVKELAEGIEKTQNMIFDKTVIKQMTFSKYHVKKIVEQYEQALLY